MVWNEEEDQKSHYLVIFRS